MGEFFGPNQTRSIHKGGGSFGLSAALPTYHDVYSLDGLGAGDPPDVAVNFVGASLTSAVSYSPPADGNAHRACMIVATFQQNVAVLDLDITFEGINVGNINSILQTGGLRYVIFGFVDIGALTGTNWVFTRTGGGVLGASFTARFYTFGDADGIVDFGTTTSNVDISVGPLTCQMLGTMAAGSLKAAIGIRGDYVGVNDFRVATPVDYTYSPLGSLGVGLLAAPVGDIQFGAALEFKLTTVDEVNPTDTWSFDGIIPAEKGGFAAFSMLGATY